MSIISDIGNKAVKVVRLTGEFSKVANKQDLPKEMDKNNNNEVDVVEFVSYFFKPNAAPVKYQDDKGKIYLITVNPDGTIISRQEDEAPKISNGDTEEKKTQEGDSSNTAQARGTRSVSSSEDIMANQCLGEILKSLAAARRKLREKTKEIIEKNVKEIKEEEKIAARKRAQAKLEQVQRRIAKLEGKIAALHNVSPRQRAIVLAKLEALKAAVSKLEQMSYDLAEGKITMDQYEDQVKVVEEKAIAVEKQLDYEKNGLLISVFGGDYKKYLKDPSHALDDGKITIDDFKPEYQGLMWTAGEISNDDEITLEELEGLRDKGQASSCEELARKLGYKGSMDDPAADVYKAAYKDLRTAAQKGELNVDKWNSIMKKYGFDKYYTMKSEAFAALFLGVKDRWLHDERVSGTLNFDRAVHRTYMTMTAMGGPDEVAAAFQIYCKSEDFFFVDFEKQGEIIAGALGINRELSAAQSRKYKE
jgi:nitrite reductase/ring-hydroxylating ferredoxin subunit